MNEYKLLALDIDGTTITNDQQITDRTRFWINKAMDSGIIVMLATGRGLQMTLPIARELGLHTPLVVLNGAEVWKTEDNLAEQYYFDSETITTLYHLGLKTNADFWGFNENGLVRKDKWTEALLRLNWMKMTIRQTDPSLFTELLTYIKQLGTIEFAHTNTFNIEITPKGRTKASGVQAVCNLLNIKMEQVMAIGDELNDLPLIHSAGLGVAMENANPKLFKAANVITKSNENDGVAYAIQHYLFNE